MTQKEIIDIIKKYKFKPIKHTDFLKEACKQEIMYAIENTIKYDNECNFKFRKGIIPEIVMDQTDSVTAIINNQTDKLCVLNFANYVYPGGGFIRGAMAQEEDLCRHSFLYNVLSFFEKTYYHDNHSNRNNELYTNKALYSKDIYFFNEDSETFSKCDVLTCAAPNWTSADYTRRVLFEDNIKCLEDRIAFMFKVAEQQNVETFIIGAWGCGVFGQNPDIVANIMKKELMSQNYGFKKVIIAIPGPSENYDAFSKKFIVKECKKKYVYHILAKILRLKC